LLSAGESLITVDDAGHSPLLSSVFTKMCVELTHYPSGYAGYSSLSGKSNPGAHYHQVGMKLFQYSPFDHGAFPGG